MYVTNNDVNNSTIFSGIDLYSPRVGNTCFDTHAGRGFCQKKRDKRGLSSFVSFGAKEEIRTPKPFQALPPQSSASTNFATFASGRMGCKNNGFFKISKFIYSYFLKKVNYFLNRILKVVPLLISDDLTYRRPR